MKLIRSTCPYCGVGCGVNITVTDDDGVNISADTLHPANAGRLCSKGAALGETINPADRLLHPQINGAVVEWDAALDTVAETFSNIIEKYGPDAVAFYVSGQLLTEDYYVVNKLAKGFIGTANIDTNSRLCMSSSVAGHKRAFGSDTVPCNYEDLDHSDLIILTGSNAAWCHPVLFQRIRKAKENNPRLKIVNIDPRKTATSEIADLQLSIQAGTDVLLFNGLLKYLVDNAATNQQYVSKYVSGYQKTIEALDEQYSVESVARLCGCDIKDILTLFELYKNTDKVISVYSQGVNQSAAGSDKVNSIINCHLATGKLGYPGAGPFSFTGQPNAMGGREVGGLANQLAAHMDFSDPEHIDKVARFWNTDNLASQEGLKAVDMFAALADKSIKAIWIMGTNPVVSMPEADKIRHALKTCEFVVVSDLFANTDTARYANVLLPALGWGEKDGTVTNSERRISRQRAFLAAPGEARADWLIISGVAQRMGYMKSFDYKKASDIFREHAALSDFENNGSRDFDIGLVKSISDTAYDEWQPTQWPINSAYPTGRKRLFDDGRFYTQDRKARMLDVLWRPPVTAPDVEYPLILNTGRIRDQWHTMTRTGLSAKLSQHRNQPFVEINPRDAAQFSIQSEDLVNLSSRSGEIVVRAILSNDIQPGMVFVPMHWNEQFASNAGVDKLVAANVDPVSGQPELKFTPVKVRKVEPLWYGFLLTTREVKLPDLDYWAKSQGSDLIHYEIAGRFTPDDWARWARKYLCREDKDVHWVEYQDPATRNYRSARIVNNRLESCMFIGPSTQLPSREWLSRLFAENSLSENDKRGLMLGKSLDHRGDTGPVVCACNQVGLNTIVQLITSDQARSVQAIGEKCGAGTQCGSCISEIQKILAEEIQTI